MMLQVNNLTIRFTDRLGGEAVHGISFAMEEGERLGIVGESGAGKTLTALAIAGLLDQQKTSVTGEVIFRDRNLLKVDRATLHRVQGRDIGFIFQEPVASLNPLMRIATQIEESLVLHTDLSKEERHQRMIRAMEDVELPDPERTCLKYPHQLSGGQCQRVMIASALICHPPLLIADEPTTALDVTVQGQILSLLKRVNQEQNVGILYISHDLSLVRRLCNRVIVMKDGNIVESGNTEDVFTNPQEDYTRRLIAAIPTREKRYA